MPIEDSIMDAFDETSGMPRPNDPWSGNHLGFYGTLSVIDRDNKATRSYVSTGYLAPNIHRKNLKILTEATASKILLDGSTATARGVEFWCDGAFHNVFATTEVILSASSVQSPRLLELSGIGDPVVLRTAGIDCVVPLHDVGNNLQEHPLTAAIYELAPGQISLDSLLQDQSLFQEHQRLYMEEHSGALAGTMSLTGFLPYATLVSEQEIGKLVSDVTAIRITGSLQLSEHESQNIVAHLRNAKSAALQFSGVPANLDIKVGY
ncbi:GMC oxidoreductase-domain-containing protein, partial [Lipomyces kononenkoae]